jgi:hypothetical protein
LPELLLLDFLLRSEKFKGSLKKENEVPRVFLSGLFIWPNWELGNQFLQAIFCTHAAAIMSPRSLELNQEAKEPSMEEAKRCKLKLPVEIKRTARIHCGGHVPIEAIASRNPVEGEKVPTPVRRSARIQGMTWKDYKEVSPSLRRVTTTSTIVARAREQSLEETIMISTFGMRCPRRRLPKAPTVVWTSLGPLPRWVPGPTNRWAPGTTRLMLHST